MSERDQRDRHRCTVVGCNPVMHGDWEAAKHKLGTGHRTAKWPIRSAEGKKRAKARNRSGYYDKYNVGDKAPEARFARDIPGGDTAFGEDDF